MNEVNPQLKSLVMDKVEEWKRQLEFRCRNANIVIEAERIIHLIHGENIYVLANPVMGQVQLYDKFGEPTEKYIPRRNFQMRWQPHIKMPVNKAPQHIREKFELIDISMRPNEVVVENPEPYRMESVLAPWLAVKLDMNGDLVADGAGLDPLVNVDELNNMMSYPGLSKLL